MMRALLVLLCAIALASCRTQAMILPVGRDAGAVYSAVIEAALFDEDTRRRFDFSRAYPPGEIRLLDSVHWSGSEQPDSTRAWLQRELPGIPARLAAAYSVRSDSARITDSIGARVRLVRLTPNEFQREIHALRGLSPLDQLLQPIRRPPVHVTLSTVVFTADSTAALVEIGGYLGPLDAAGYVVWLAHTSAGWVVRSQVMRWIS